MSKCFIFDIDGTLIDSNKEHALAWQRAFASKGKEFSLKQIWPHIGKGSDQFLPNFLSKGELQKIGEELSQAHGEIFKREYLPRLRPFPKVRELFKAIRNADGRIALASSSNQKEVEVYETIAQISDLIEKSTTSDDAEKTKPAPDIFNAAMRQLGNPNKSAVLVIGDSPHDATAARTAGLRIIGVLSGGFSEADLKSHGCISVFQDPADLLAHINVLLKR
ncbi:MAG TPA: HAD family hydrolase [Candidatus Angelobacter sp.]|nr:HAD family hydrolase [Candidatus Angelobacter sp.]